MKLQIVIEMEVPDSMPAADFGRMTDAMRDACKPFGLYGTHFRVKRVTPNPPKADHHVGAGAGAGSGSELYADAHFAEELSARRTRD